MRRELFMTMKFIGYLMFMPLFFIVGLVYRPLKWIVYKCSDFDKDFVV